MKKRRIIKGLFILFLSCFFVISDNVVVNAKQNNMNPPAQSYLNLVEDKEAFYDELDGQQGNELLESLASILTENHKYYTSYDEVRGGIAFADEDPNDSSKVIVFYGGIGVSNQWQPNNYSDCEAWNREHVWCKSLSGGLYTSVGGSTRDAGTDIHQLKPSVNVLNSTRNNSKYADLHKNGDELIYNHTSGVIHTDNYMSMGLFEPRDEIKGDVARILMYLYTHYSNEIATSTPGKNGDMKIENIIEDNNPWDLLLYWNTLDPVDEFEAKRNDYCLSVTGVSNPYIDHPEYAEMIWCDDYIGPGANIDERYYETVNVDKNYYEIDIDSSDISIVAEATNDEPLYYKSCNEKVVKIGSNGKLIPQDVGIAKVIISAGVISTSVTVRVYDSNEKLNIKFYTNDGTNDVFTTQIKQFGDTLDVPKDIPEYEGYSFKFWSASNGLGAKEYDFSTPLSKEISLYAIWSKDETTSGGYIKITDANDINGGDKVVIACPSKGKAAGVFYSTGVYLTSVDATFDGDKLTCDSAEVFTIGKDGNNYTFTSSSGVMIATSAAKAFSANGTNTWTITVTAAGMANITCTNTSYGSIQFNASSPRFLNYTSNQTAIALYKYVKPDDVEEYEFSIKTSCGLEFDAKINQMGEITRYNNVSIYIIMEAEDDNLKYAYTTLDNFDDLYDGFIDDAIKGDVSDGVISIDDFTTYKNGIALVYYVVIDGEVILSDVRTISINLLIDIYLEDEDILVDAGYSQDMIEQIYGILEEL